MKITKITTLLIALLFSTAACTSGGLISTDISDPTPPVEPPINQLAVLFSSNINTKAQDNSNFAIEEGDEFGKFMLYSGGTLQGEGNLGIHSVNKPNLKYTAKADGFLIPDGKTMLFPSDKTELVDFISYYPYNANAANIDTKTFNIPVDIKDQNSKNIHILFSDNAVDHSKNASTVVNLKYEYALSKIDIVTYIAEGSNLKDADLIGMTMAVTNIPTTATFDLTNQTCSGHANILVHNETTNTGGLIANMAADGKSGSAIFIPMAAKADQNMIFIFKLTNGNVFKYKVTNAQAFESSKKYKFSFGLQRNSLDVSTEIVDWVQGDTIDQELDQD